MRQKIGKHVVETTFPEREKFTAPLLLVPGLWSGSWIWEEMAWYFCQRGWSSWAIDFPKKQTDSDIGNTPLSERLQTVREVTRGFDASPVLIGFDAGGLFGLLATLDITPRALVWISPLFPYCWQFASAKPPSFSAVTFAISPVSLPLPTGSGTNTCLAQPKTGVRASSATANTRQNRFSTGSFTMSFTHYFGRRGPASACTCSPGPGTLPMCRPLYVCG